MDELPDRMRAKIDVRTDTGCWVWTGSTTRNGYGRIQMGRTVGVKLAHRVVYELLVHDPKDSDLDHLCRVRNCVNPDHLEPVSRSENLLRGEGGGLAAQRYAKHLYCPQGHPLFGDNLYLYVKKNGVRNKMCRTCRAMHDRARRERRRA